MRMKILAFDTATAACTVALMIGGEINERFEIAPQRHAELILPMIDNVLSEAGINLQAAGCIAFGQGPGSFMGVRIAAGIAQGLAFSADLPVIPVSTLQTLAQTAYQQTKSSEVIAGWDARMNAIYWGIYELEQDGSQIMTPLQADALDPPETLIIPATQNWLLAGNAWSAYSKQLPPVLDSYAKITDIFPRAKAMLAIAAVKYSEGKVRNALEIEPVYLRDKVAHIKKD